MLTRHIDIVHRRVHHLHQHATRVQHHYHVKHHGTCNKDTLLYADPHSICTTKAQHSRPRPALLVSHYRMPKVNETKTHFKGESVLSGPDNILRHSSRTKKAIIIFSSDSKHNSHLLQFHSNSCYLDTKIINSLYSKNAGIDSDHLLLLPLHHHPIRPRLDTGGPIQHRHNQTSHQSTPMHRLRRC